MANIDMRLPESDTSLLAGMSGKALGEFVYGERFESVPGEARKWHRVNREVVSPWERGESHG